MRTGRWRPLLGLGEAAAQAVRAVPPGAVALVLPFLWPGSASAGVLAAVAAAQRGDAVIGPSRREWTMLAGSLIATLIPAATAVAVATS